ncbi:MAG TPA: hypothetical protein VEW66_00060 [Thermomicrobiales bacterium]|nr:hypothetical protein [Thermomicrobiales bacterium]
MAPFATQIDDWRDFFTLTGTAAATIIGLLFVSISLRSDIRKAAETSLVRTMVSHNFLMLLVVLLISLYFMVPGIDHDSLGFSVILTAGIPGVFFAMDLWRLRHDGSMQKMILLWSFIVPILSFALTVAIGVAFLFSDDTELSWFVTVMALFLVIPTKNSWELLLQSHET